VTEETIDQEEVTEETIDQEEVTEEEILEEFCECPQDDQNIPIDYVPKFNGHHHATRTL